MTDAEPLRHFRVRAALLTRAVRVLDEAGQVRMDGYPGLGDLRVLERGRLVLRVVPTTIFDATPARVVEDTTGRLLGTLRREGLRGTWRLTPLDGHPFVAERVGFGLLRRWRLQRDGAEVGALAERFHPLARTVAVRVDDGDPRLVLALATVLVGD